MLLCRLYVLLLERLVLPQRLFMSLKNVNTRRRGTTPIHDVPYDSIHICTSSLHFCAVFGEGQYIGPVERCVSAIVCICASVSNVYLDKA